MLDLKAAAVSDHYIVQADCENSMKVG